MTLSEIKILYNRVITCGKQVKLRGGLYNVSYELKDEFERNLAELESAFVSYCNPGSHVIQFTKVNSDTSIEFLSDRYSLLNDVRVLLVSGSDYYKSVI